MPPKKGKKGGGKKKKSAKPEWMSEDLWVLSQNLPKLTEFYSGEIKESKGKDAVPNITITRTQAGLFIWQMLFPSTKAAKEKRTEGIKLQLVEWSVKILASGKPQDMTSAVGILTAMVSEHEVQRQLMLDSKPAPIPHLLNALSQDSASLKAAVCALLRVIACRPDSRPRLWRALKDWSWTPLVACLGLQEMSQLGGRNAAFDVAMTLDALGSVPEGDVANIACNKIVEAGGLKLLLEVLENRISHPMAKACACSTLNHIMRRAPLAVCEQIMLELGGLPLFVALFGHQVVPLLNKAHAAACLLRFIMPESLWRDSSALQSKSRLGTAMAMAGMASSSGAMPGIADATVPPDPGSPPVPATPAVGLSASTDALKASAARAADAASGDPAAAAAAAVAAVPDIELLDDETRDEVLRRARIVASHPAAIPALVRLCAGPDGPLPDLEALAAAAALSGAESGAETDGAGKKKKGKKGKKGKKKKGKLEPGMAEAQTYGSAVLRLVSLGDDLRQQLMAAGVLRYLLPLLESKLSAARWNARQTCINLSMTPAFVPKLILYKVPDYIHGANVPQSHFQRPRSNAAGANGGVDAAGRPTSPTSGGRPPLASGMRPPPALKPSALKIDGGAASSAPRASIATPTVTTPSAPSVDVPVGHAAPPTLA